MSQRFTITTPIYYVNDVPHIGHSYTTIAADVISRLHRMRGDEVFFLTGTDEHGQKVLEAANRRGVTPQQHTDELHLRFKNLWARLDVQYDDFVRTTDAKHQAVVRRVLQELYDRGEIFQATYAGWYSTAAERFWTEKDLIDGKCPESGLPVEWVEEMNYFFRMGRYADQLRAWLEAHPDWVRPESRRNELIGALKKDVGDLCISRPKSRMSWGIPMPFDEDYVTYVWFDALLNYVSATGIHDDPAAFALRWPADFQLLGKDILTTHTVYWGTMLFAMGLEPARCLYAHGWWTVEGQKMSKSLGNVVDPNLLVDAYGPDALRYILMSEKAFGADGDFSHKAFLLRYNAELANDIGNLAHRAISMTEKWLGGVVPALDADRDEDHALSAASAMAVSRFMESVDALDYRGAVEALVTLSSAGNKYIDSMAPWALNKAGDTARLGGVLRRTLELCRVVGTLLTPFCPNKGAELLRRLSAGEPRLTDDLAQLDRLAEGGALSLGEPLFPRLDELPPAIQAALEKASESAALRSLQVHAPMPTAKAEKPPKAEKAAKAPNPPAKAAPAAPEVKMSETTTSPEASAQIVYDDFAKVQLRAGRVVEAARHPNADRLLQLKVDVGEAEPRTIVAGIADRYAPEELVGLQVVVVVNLKPVKLRGVMSHGMLLAAGGEGVRAMVTTTEAIEPGTIIR
ncbi:methionine--tRNA ligase [Myxococcota bacterium]|nr:methionine--tRNA ligase [Myxococcota bacterium]